MNILILVLRYVVRLLVTGTEVAKIKSLISVHIVLQPRHNYDKSS